MCEKKQFRYCPSEIDKCMRRLIKWLNLQGHITVACCCGHNKYQMTIIVKSKSEYREVLSDTIIPRKRNFYRRDKEGYYYIPEVSSHI